ncbi:IS3 family transposase [Paraglaciecola arctica]|uniref:IS3 family transposase n=1 Tax=Paraglaciecola arctica TaxID=1128911 RepID=UPI001C079C46|nr:IS3 family transposase [Paraglaciecola arctica]
MHATRSEAKADLFDYVEVSYNRARIHSHLGHESPDENIYSQASHVSIKLGEDHIYVNAKVSNKK